MRQTPKVLEVQERAQCPLSPCKFGMTRISPGAGAAKKLSFLSVCLSVTLPWLRLPPRSSLGGVSVAAA